MNNSGYIMSNYHLERNIQCRELFPILRDGFQTRPHTYFPKIFDSYIAYHCKLFYL